MRTTRNSAPGVQEIKKKTDGPIGTGTVYVSTVKDAAVETEREYERDMIEQANEDPLA